MERLSSSSRLGWLLVLALCVPVAAHKIQIAEDVGGTLHIEPNDYPEAGKPALTWFALTRRGGQVIPLKQCNCQLVIYAEPRVATAPLLKPALEPVAVEQYKGIPGAAIAFPKAGAYELQLRGTPTAGANFQPFELKFNVTVTGAAPTASPQAARSPSESAEQQTPATGRALPIFFVPGVIIALGILWLVVRLLKQKSD